MTLAWDGEREDAVAARRAAEERSALLAARTGDSLEVGNEFAQIRVTRVETRNGARLLIESPRSAQWVALDPLELEALTWQSTATFSAMIGNPYGSLFQDEA